MRIARMIEKEVRGDFPRGGSICGVLVCARRDAVDEASAALARLPGVEIHHRTEDGRLVVTVEDTDEATAGEVMHRFYDVDGVISASLVYHHHATAHHGTGELQGEAS